MDSIVTHFNQIIKSMSNAEKENKILVKYLAKRGWKVAKKKTDLKNAIEVFQYTTMMSDGKHKPKQINIVLFKDDKKVISISDAQKKIKKELVKIKQS